MNQALGSKYPVHRAGATSGGGGGDTHPFKFSFSTVSGEARLAIDDGRVNGNTAILAGGGDYLAITGEKKIVLKYEASYAAPDTAIEKQIAAVDSVPADEVESGSWTIYIELGTVTASGGVGSVVAQLVRTHIWAANWGNFNSAWPSIS